jgi:hypothetical protein
MMHIKNATLFPEKTPRFESSLQHERAGINCFAHRSIERPNLGDTYRVSSLPNLLFHFRQSETASEADHKVHGQRFPPMDCRQSFQSGSSRTRIDRRSTREGGWHMRVSAIDFDISHLEEAVEMTRNRCRYNTSYRVVLGSTRTFTTTG